MQPASVSRSRPRADWHALTCLLPALLLTLLLAPTARAQFAEVQKVPNPEANTTFTRFGIDVAFDGNVMVVGANQNDTDADGNNPIDGAGAAFVYEKEGTAWVFKAKLVAPQRQRFTLFGRWVAVSGGTIAVSNNSDDFDANGGNPVDGAGSVCLYEKVAGVWTFRQKLIANDRQVGDDLGRGIAIEGNLLVAGSENGFDTQNENELEVSGAVYVFERGNGGVWAQVQKLVPNDRERGDWFADGAVDLSGTTIVVGSRDKNFDSDGPSPVLRAGAVYVFEKTGTAWAQTARLFAPDARERDRLGQQVAVSGNTLIATATSNDYDVTNGNFQSNSGAAYVFAKTGGTWAFQAKLVANDRAESEDFATDVDIQGNRVVVGSASYTDAEGKGSVRRAGAVYVFDRSGTTWSQTQKLVASDRAEFDKLGQSVYLSGGTLAAGSDARPDGAVYVFGPVVVCDPRVTQSPTTPSRVCQGDTLAVTFSTVGACPSPAPNSFTVQLSNAVGSFANLTVLGTTVPGTTRFALPPSLPAGTGYRVRILSGGQVSVASLPFQVVGPSLSGSPTVSGVPVCRGQALTVSFSLPEGSCAFPDGNVFTAQLSSAFGSFGNPTSLGPVTPGQTSVTIPAGVAAGTGYRIRVVSSSPVLTSGVSASFRVNACAGRLSAEEPQLVVAPNPVMGGEIRVRIGGMDNPAFFLTTSSGRTVPVGVKVDTTEFVLVPRQALVPGLYVVVAREGTLRLSQRVLVVE